MDHYYGPTGGGGSKTDLTRSTLAISVSGSGSGSSSGSWWKLLTRRRRRLCASPSPPPSAFLTPAFDSCASPTSDVDPTLLRLTRSLGPLRFSSSSSDSSNHSSPAAAVRRLLQMRSSAQSPTVKARSALPPLRSPAFKTPVKVVDVQEDVLVMDGVLVSDSTRSNTKWNNSAEFGSSTNSSGTGVFYRRELCRSWDENRNCRYGSRCQFSHGKEETRSDLRGPRSWNQKNEPVGGSAAKILPSSGTSPFSKFVRCISPPGPITPNPAPASERTTTKPSEIAPDIAPVSTFSWPPTEEEDACIVQILYGPSCRRRLPVFQQICSQ